MTIELVIVANQLDEQEELMDWLKALEDGDEDAVFARMEARESRLQQMEWTLKERNSWYRDSSERNDNAARLRVKAHS